MRDRPMADRLHIESRCRAHRGFGLVDDAAAELKRVLAAGEIARRGYRVGTHADVARVARASDDVVIFHNEKPRVRDQHAADFDCAEAELLRIELVSYRAHRAADMLEAGLRLDEEEVTLMVLADVLERRTGLVLRLDIAAPGFLPGAAPAYAVERAVDAHDAREVVRR